MKKYLLIYFIIMLSNPILTMVNRVVQPALNSSTTFQTRHLPGMVNQYARNYSLRIHPLSDITPLFSELGYLERVNDPNKPSSGHYRHYTLRGFNKKYPDAIQKLTI